MTDIKQSITRIFPLSDESRQALQAMSGTARDPIKTIVDHILHVDVLYTKEKKFRDMASTLVERSRLLVNDSRRKIAMIVDEVNTAGLADKMLSALLLSNWDFLTAEQPASKTDMIVWYIKQNFAHNTKLSKNEASSISRIVGADVKPIIKTLKDRGVLIVKKEYSCPECGNVLHISGGGSFECDECFEEFDSTHDLERDIWYEKGPNYS